MIPAADLELLRCFDSRGHFVLSAYLRLDSSRHRESAGDQIMRLIRARLRECGSDAECREAISEDMEIVDLYLRTNGHRQHAGLAIFSCAAELFWRAYPLETAVDTQVTVAPAFDLEPLQALAPAA